MKTLAGLVPTRRAPVSGCWGDGPDVLVDEAVVDLLPGPSGVAGTVDAVLGSAGVEDVGVAPIDEDGGAEAATLEADGAGRVTALTGVGGVEAVCGAEIEFVPVGSSHVTLLHPIRSGPGNEAPVMV